MAGVVQQSPRRAGCDGRGVVCTPCQHRSLLGLLLGLLSPVTGRNQGSAYQQLHAGVIVVNVTLLFLFSACDFHFVSPEHVCSILASLLRNLRGQQRTRLLNKFTENDSEKVSTENAAEPPRYHLGGFSIAPGVGCTR